MKRRRGSTTCSSASGSFRLKEDPLFATSVGRHEYDDRLPVGRRFADLERRIRRSARPSSPSSTAIDRAKLPADDQVNYDIFKRQLENGIAVFELGDYQMPFNADSGFHSGFSRLAEEMPLATGQGLRELHQPPARLAALRARADRADAHRPRSAA